MCEPFTCPVAASRRTIKVDSAFAIEQMGASWIGHREAASPPPGTPRIDCKAAVGSSDFPRRQHRVYRSKRRKGHNLVRRRGSALPLESIFQRQLCCRAADQRPCHLRLGVPRGTLSWSLCCTVGPEVHARGAPPTGGRPRAIRRGYRRERRIGSRRPRSRCVDLSSRRIG
jgi:hypothetical protein